MIHSARRTVLPLANMVFTLLDFKKWGRTDEMCENNDPYRPWLRWPSGWKRQVVNNPLGLKVGRVDQLL